MRGAMGNILETDSDAASISENEKERTEGDGMESSAILDKTTPNSNSGDGLTDEFSDGTAPSLQPSDSDEPTATIENLPEPSTSTTPVPQSSDSLSDILLKDGLLSGAYALDTTASQIPSSGRSFVTSPRELPPRNQLIQLKPTMSKPRPSSKNSIEFPADGINKQKNPKFIPYEPYKGAVRSMENKPKNYHSRTASDISLASNSIEDSSLNLSDSNPDVQQASIAQSTANNTHEKPGNSQMATGSKGNYSEARLYKQEQTILKQTNAISFCKERLKIADKDNNELHKENIRLKKLLVDSLSGDVCQDHDTSQPQPTMNESVEALSNEIEVWRSKFLSSCVLVEQLTRENGILHEALGSATHILKDLKLSSSLSVDDYEVINAWLRSCRMPPQPNEPNN